MFIEFFPETLLPVVSANADRNAEEKQTMNKINAIKSRFTIAKIQFLYFEIVNLNYFFLFKKRARCFQLN